MNNLIPEYKILMDNVYTCELLCHCTQLIWEEKVKARKELFMSDNAGTIYSYDKYENANEYKSIAYTPEIADWIDYINNAFNTDYNLCFLNRYDTQHDHIGWHADDSNIMDHDHPIAVISLGQPREIWWKPKGDKGKIPDNQKQLLESGSIFIMPANFQRHYLHRIPKHDKPCGMRISLTLRKKMNE